MNERIEIVLFFFFISFSVIAQKVPVNFGGTIVDAFTRQAINGEVQCSLLRLDSTVMMTTKSYEPLQPLHVHLLVRVVKVYLQAVVQDV